ncbi:hypothetical protein Tco_1055196 [Tanacetum coccineum]|uniref:Uncharacterized protein n=1 Tax=Tanacetum coccineum TaxID=301880 RepID=A0ABQ5GZY1_9ASTR
MKLEKALLDFDSHQEKSLSHLRTQLGQQHDDMIGKINLLWKTVSEKLNDVSTPENARNSIDPKISAAISYDEREELRKNGNKSPSKLFSLNKDSNTEEEDVLSTNVHDLDSMMRNREEVREQGKKEVFNDEGVEEVFDDETKEEEDDDTKYYKSPPAIKELVYHE